MDQSVHVLLASSLDLFAAARAAGQYEVAYHALCGALHAAESLEDSPTCTVVEHLANECRDAVDANGTTHKLSSQSAAMRGHESVFKQLAVMAVSARLRMEVDGQVQKRQERPRAPLA